MNPDHFRDSPCGQLLKVGLGETAYWAFVPNPLPPKIKADWTLTAAISEADRALSELAGIGRTLPNPHLLIGPFLRREAVLSSRIEGTQTGIADLYAYEAGQLRFFDTGRAAAIASDAQEVLNYVHAIEYGLQRVADLPVSLRLIRELHDRLMVGVRGERATPGEFRRSQNWIGPAGCTLNQAEFVPPPVSEMTQELGALEQYLHSDDIYPPLVRLALIHYQFEAIHPFIDGNGRIGRLIISLLLVQWGMLPQPLLYLSAYFARHRQRYYDLLIAISQRGVWQDWLLFFLRGVTEQSQDAIVRARQLQDLQAGWRERLAQARTSALLLSLVDNLFQSPVLTIPEAQRLLGITYRSAQLNIEKLVEAGILQQAGESSYGKTFIAHGILEIIGSDSHDR